jgi:hypothetical protein
MAELTEEQAQEMLKQLAEHYGEPVRPVNEYCNAIRNWMSAIEQGCYGAIPDSGNSQFQTWVIRLVVEEGRSPWTTEKVNEDYIVRRHSHLPEADVRAAVKDLVSRGELVQRDGALVRGGTHQGLAYVHMLRTITIDISKSALLGRLIYAGEKFRQKPCPDHKGALNMHEWIGHSSTPQCRYYCGGTGWLPEPGDKAAEPVVLCNKPYEGDLWPDANGVGQTEYCRKLPGHDGNCDAWMEIGE